jgi:hypothetical protein
MSDLAMGYITRRKAEEVYGIVLANDLLDASATAERRQELRNARPRLTLVERDTPQDSSYFPRCWLHPATGERLHITDGDLVELLAQDQAAAPMRLAAALDSTVGSDQVCIPASLRAFYGLQCDAAHTLRMPDHARLYGAQTQSVGSC